MTCQPLNYLTHSATLVAASAFLLVATSYAQSSRGTTVPPEQMGVTGVYSNMSTAEVVTNLNGRGISTKIANGGAVQFRLGDGTTKATVNGIVNFVSTAGAAVESVGFTAEGEAASAQYVSWLFQTSGRYGASKSRHLTGTLLIDTFCYSRQLAVQVHLSDHRATLLFTRTRDALAICTGAPQQRDFDAVAYQVGAPSMPPPISATGNTSGRAIESAPNRASLERRYADLGYCHGLYLRLSSLDGLPAPRRRLAAEAMVRVREKGRVVQHQLGYSDAQAEATFGQAAALRLTSGLRNEADVRRAVADCKSKDAS